MRFTDLGLINVGSKQKGMDILMNFLLVGINSKYIHSNPAIYSLRSYAGQYKDYVTLSEYTINNFMQDILADIYMRRPDVLAFSCYIWNWEMVCALAEELHKLMPDTPIWLGGPEVSSYAENVLGRLPQVKGIMLGEGEETFKELLLHYVSHLGAAVHAEDKIIELKNIAGLCYREDGTILKTRSRQCMDLDDIPFFYEESGVLENRIMYYESSRGCPFRCSYCLSAIDKQVRFKGISKVKEELLFFLNEKVKQVKFIDRTFNCNHQHAMIIWQFIRDHDNGITNFHFEISAEILTMEHIELLKSMRPGLIQLEIGIQSANEKTLKEINRFANMRLLRERVRELTGMGNVHIHLDLIAGLPYEDMESFQRSFNEVYSMYPEQLQLGFLKVLKGSPMYEKADEYGICYLSKPPYEVLSTNWLSYEDILRLKQIEEMIDIFYNSSQFCHTLALLETNFETSFEMYQELGAYFEEKGYFLKHPSRGYRYEILLQFAIACDKEHEECYKELLIYDLYLREKAKSRPEYAVSPKQFKERIYDFYKKEEQDREILKDYTGYHARQMMGMTHIEAFHYPVWEINRANNKDFKICRMEEPQFILFDYGERDALKGNARTYILQI